MNMVTKDNEFKILTSIDLTNHHNAACCPYCNPYLDKQYLEIQNLKRDVIYWKDEVDKLRAKINEW